MDYQVYHIGFVTHDLNNALAFYRKLGFDGSSIEEDLVDKFRCAAVDVHGVRVLLMEPTDPDGPVGRYLAKRGEGFHHLALRVSDCHAAVEELRDQGVEFFGSQPREQSYEIGAFIKPSSANGILVEIVQPKP